MRRTPSSTIQIEKINLTLSHYLPLPDVERDGRHRADRVGDSTSPMAELRNGVLLIHFGRKSGRRPGSQICMDIGGTGTA